MADTPEALAELEDLILEAIVTPDATPYGAAIRNKGRDALKTVLARLAEAERNVIIVRDEWSYAAGKWQEAEARLRAVEERA
jgi:hypothetical protein